MTVYSIDNESLIQEIIRIEDSLKNLDLVDYYGYQAANLLEDGCPEVAKLALEDQERILGESIKAIDKVVRRLKSFLNEQERARLDRAMRVIQTDNVVQIVNKE